MGAEVFLSIYIVLVAVMIAAEILILSNSKVQHLKISYKSLKTICESLVEEELSLKEERLAREINRFYNEYIQEEPQIKKFFPNVVVWCDAIIFRIDCGQKRALVLREYVSELKNARDILEKQNPFNKCEKYQQGILCDIRKIETADNQIVVQNIISRTEEEFLRLSGEVKKNNRLNIVSIAIGVIGIIVSILMAIIKL